MATITGTGVAEAGPCLWLAEDVFVAASGIAFNDEGLDQLIPVVERSCLADEMTSLVLQCAGGMYFHPQSGVSHHPDMVIGPLDHRKVIAYLPGIDFQSWRWLKDHDFEIVECETDEHVLYGPANLTLLEPGRVIMMSEAPNAVAAGAQGRCRGDRGTLRRIHAHGRGPALLDHANLARRRPLPRRLRRDRNTWRGSRVS